MSFVLSAAVGLATNAVTAKPSSAWLAALTALVLCGTAVQVAISTMEIGPGAPKGDGGTTPSGEVWPEGASRQEMRLSGGSFAVQANGPVNIGTSPPRAALAIAVVAVIASAAVLAVALIALKPDEASIPSRPKATTKDGSLDPYALVTTITSTTNLCHAVVFPRAASPDASAFINRVEYPSHEDLFMKEELDVGAYAYGEAEIHLNAQSNLPQQVTIYNIRLVDVEVKPPVEGSLISLQTCGGDAVNRMDILLNEPDRGPFLEDEQGHRTDRRYFDSQVINLAPGNKESLAIKATVNRGGSPGSYSFRLAVDFEVDGNKYTKVVDREGQPFRVTGQVCKYDVVRMPRQYYGPLETRGEYPSC
ncbi:hypothetical protein ACGF3C_11005 [Micromonospora sp. NPDC047762]|uniref:hypothetical protein n=1 Tax=Micromonospora sp. NPDC047762 TaxID=3364255 RepID=UPI003719E52B